VTGPAASTPPQVTVYVRPGDPDCALVLRYLEDRGIDHAVRDVTVDPSASAVLFGRIGRVAVPAIEAGGRMLVGYDPVQLARFLPQPKGEEEHVSFGAAVRSVSPELAHERGLPATYGVEVGRVTPGSAAEAAGIVVGDLIVGIGAYTLHGGAEQFRTAVAARRPGDAMQLTVWRERAEIPVAVSFPVGAASDA
jgi:S1-C subfamily serine protease